MIQLMILAIRKIFSVKVIGTYNVLPVIIIMFLQRNLMMNCGMKQRRISTKKTPHLYFSRNEMSTPKLPIWLCGS